LKDIVAARQGTERKQQDKSFIKQMWQKQPPVTGRMSMNTGGKSVQSEKSLLNLTERTEALSHQLAQAAHDTPRFSDRQQRKEAESYSRAVKQIDQKRRKAESRKMLRSRLSGS